MFFTKVLQANFLAAAWIQLTVQMLCLYYAVEVWVLRFIGFYLYLWQILILLKPDDNVWNKRKQGNGSGLLHDTSCMVHTFLCNKNLYNLLWKPESRRGYRCSCYESSNVNEDTCGEHRHLVYIAHKELHNCKLTFLFKGSTNTLKSGMPGELLHFCFCGGFFRVFFLLFQKNTKGKQKVD